MADIPRQSNIVLVEHRCWTCGRWWACEQFGHGHIQTWCPWCSGKEIHEMGQEAARLGRVIAALRGALRRLRR